jgi:peptide deformylase
LELGDPRLYDQSETVLKSELKTIKIIIEDLHDTMMDFRNRHNIGRAIAAPQIGVMKRIIYLNTGKPEILINPKLTFPDDQIMEIWDDCMSFPNLLVKVKRFKRCIIQYEDMEGQQKIMQLEGDLSELIQHEYDHLDGVLAVDRAIDNRSFALKSAIQYSLNIN